MNILKSLSVAGVMAFVIGGAFAAENLDAKVTLKGSEVRLTLPAGYYNATLSVSGPDGFYARAFSKNGSPSIDLIRAGGTTDGEYTYEVTAASSQKAVDKNPMDNGRDGVDKSAGVVGAAASGSFIANGGIISQAAMANIKE